MPDLAADDPHAAAWERRLRMPVIVAAVAVLKALKLAKMIKLAKLGKSVRLLRRKLALRCAAWRQSRWAHSRSHLRLQRSPTC
ncbi:hypothetical protein BH20ACT17_BH20ACT17_15790 [soil metagenome]